MGKDTTDDEGRHHQRRQPHQRGQEEAKREWTGTLDRDGDPQRNTGPQQTVATMLRHDIAGAPTSCTVPDRAASPRRVYCGRTLSIA